VYYPEDYWGYYNGMNNNTLIPSDFIADGGYRSVDGANRNPDPRYSNACMIKAIKYPTGGSTVFQFEQNNVNGSGLIIPSNPGYVGGFRIGSITNFDENNKLVGIKTYEYSGAQARQITQEFFEYIQNSSVHNEYIDPEGWSTDCWINSIDAMVLSDPLLPLEVGAGLPIMYTTVVEYNGTKINNSGKTVYQYNPPYSPSDFFDNPEHPYQYEEPRDYHSFHYDKGNYVPELISKTEYSFDGTNYHPVSKTENVYTKLFTQEFQTGIKLTRTLSLPVYQGGYVGGMFIQNYILSIVAIDTKAYQEASLLTNSKNYTFNPNDSTKYVLTNTDITYNENNLEIKGKSTLSSKGDLLKTFYKYPFDYCNSSNVYCRLVNNNILSPVIEQIDAINATPLKSVRTNYSYWKSDGLSYSSASGNLEIGNDENTNTAGLTFTLTGPTQFNVNLHFQMCVGNYILSVNGPTSIVKYYSGNGSVDGNGNCLNSPTQDVQEVFNLSNGNYTITFSYNAAPGYPNAGFEGTASFTGTTTDPKLDSYPTSTPTVAIYPSSVDVKKGNNPYETRLNYDSYDINGNIMGVSKSNDEKEIYIWGYNGNYPVAKIVNGDYPTVESLLGRWAAVRNFSLQPAPTDAEVKAFLSPLINSATAKAQKMLVTIYTYAPLIGMTSQTDPTSKTTYYEYDSFGRLKVVRDDKGNILKTFDYHYKK
jgi:YD repeat-containing protein